MGGKLVSPLPDFISQEQIELRNISVSKEVKRRENRRHFPPQTNNRMRSCGSLDICLAWFAFAKPWNKGSQHERRATRLSMAREDELLSMYSAPAITSSVRMRPIVFAKTAQNEFQHWTSEAYKPQAKYNEKFFLENNERQKQGKKEKTRKSV